nr:hypothetical protein [Sedimentibacter sp.]
MKKNKILTVLVLFALLIMVSCGKSNSRVSKDENLLDESQNDSDVKNVIESTDENYEEDMEDDANKVVSSLDGLKYYQEDLQRRPVAVSIDNHPKAR